MVRYNKGQVREIPVCSEIHLLCYILYIIENSHIISRMVACTSRCLTLILLDVQFVLICCKILTFSFSLWQRNIKKEMGCLANSRPQLESLFL